MRPGPLFRRSQPPKQPSIGHRVLLASEGRAFTRDVIDATLQLIRDDEAHVRVLVIARLWGTGLGFPHPGLRPSKHEMAEYQAHVAYAVKSISDASVSVDSHIITTRHPCKSILKEARRQNSDVVVMGADARRRWFIRDFMWSQEPYRVRRQARIPIRLIGPEVQPSHQVKR